MSQSSLQTATSYGPVRVNYVDWGSADNPRVLVCAHGFTRNCRDYDWAARALENDFRIICPDMPGRGDSSRLHADGYNYFLYAEIITALLAHIGATQVDWLGTSMGGVLGSMISILPTAPIRNLILNDVGPFATKEAVRAIGRYIGNDDRFANFEEVLAFFKNIYESWGALTDEQWRHIAIHSSRALPDGSFCLAYDPAISQPFKAAEIADVDLWPVFETIRCPILVLRGQESTILSAQTAHDMTVRGHNVRLLEFAGIGHAPPLMCDEQIEPLRHFLLTTPELAAA